MTEKRAVIYARVSTHRQARDELPLTSQLDRCHQHAEALGAAVAHEFVDEGLSGREADRPAFQAAQQGKNCYTTSRCGEFGRR